MLFIVRSGCLLLLFFSREIVVDSQMDVLLKRTSSMPILHQELPSDPDANLDSSSSSSEELSERRENIQDAIRKMGERLDVDNTKHIDHLYPVNPSLLNIKPTNNLGIPKVTSNLDPFDIDEPNPLRDIFKIIDESFQLPMETPREPIGPDMMMRNNHLLVPMGPTDDQDEPIGVLTIIRLDDDGMIPPQGHIGTPVGTIENKGSMDDEMASSFIQGILKSVFETMNDMVDLLHRTNGSLSVGGNDSRSAAGQKVDIKIKDHGRTYEIPPNAYVERSNPGMVNITWKSGMKGFNNSLCMNVTKNNDGIIVFHHIFLRMLNENGLQEYSREDPIRVGENKDNSTEINLADGVGIKFPHPDSLDVVVVEKRGKFSVQWMAVSIALLGLIVAGLVMLLSYILHTRNKYITRKDSMFKEPIA